MMGDISAEPSMEEILSSIKRIIAEENDGAQVRPRRTERAVAAAVEHEPETDEILELSDPMPAPRSPSDPSRGAAPVPPVQPHAEPMRAPEQPRATEPRPEPRMVAEAEPEPILSHQAAAATRAPLETLSRMLVKPEPQGDGTLEGLVREMLRPMLREWLDAHLPEMVETMVAREIAKLTAPTR